MQPITEHGFCIFVKRYLFICQPSCFFDCGIVPGQCCERRKLCGTVRHGHGRMFGGDGAGKIYNIRIILPCFGHAISPFKLNAKLELIAQTNCEVHILNKFSLYKNIQKVLLIHVFDHGYTHTKFPLWFVSDDFIENRRNIRKPVFHENPAPVGWALSGSSPVFTVKS